MVPILGQPTQQKNVHSPLGMDYSAFLGTNVVHDERDPFGGTVPRDPQGYAAYQQYHEQQILENIGYMGMLKITANCEGKGAHDQPIRLKMPKQGHMGCAGVHACDHSLHQDPVHPEGIYYIPLATGSKMGYYLCSICFKSRQAYKLDLGIALKLKCGMCLDEEIERVMAIDPGKVINLALKR